MSDEAEDIQRMREIRIELETTLKQTEKELQASERRVGELEREKRSLIHTIAILTHPPSISEEDINEAFRKAANIRH